MNNPDRRLLLLWLGSAAIASLTSVDRAAAKSKGKGNSGGNGASGRGRGRSNASGSGAKANAKPGRSPDNSDQLLDQDKALRAVAEGRALPLRDLLPQAEQRFHAIVIDADLEDEGERLLYRLKMLSSRGRVFIVSIDAITGRPIDDPDS